ncbi:arylamine N-acetyltransferase [Streptosporangiaceae bacterium NEAU-GS5]|nr:arylamine N-acetyltransferase [Streptosporangiaceae bacterium NEAU-GS5]
MGLNARPPVDLGGLFTLQRAHVERVPYENLDIWRGRRVTIDPAESAARITRGRGGYCYHLNGGLSLLLKELGFAVTRHFGGVQPSHGIAPGASGNHLVLTVAGLPSEHNPGGEWLVDAGLGDGLHDPLPLVEGVYEQGPFRYGMRPSTAEPGGWRFDHDPRGSFLGMDYRPVATEMSAFQAKHEYLSTSPESGFVKLATVQRRDAGGVDSMRGLVLQRTTRTISMTTLDRPADYFSALADVYGLTLDDLTHDERTSLWNRLYAAHEEWLSAAT